MQPTIVIVEDDHSIVAVLEEFLADEGYAVISLTSVGALMAYLAQQIPQLILTDINLPDGDGGTIGSLLASNEATRGIPIIVMSGHNELALNLDHHAGSFLAKPFDLGYLLRMIQQLLRVSNDNATS